MHVAASATVRQVFYYYGAKNRLAPKYPPPLHDIVIEPFAGSAGYSQHWRRTIKGAVLFDADERVVDTWRQLQAMTAPEILAIPIPTPGRRYDDPFVDMLIKMAATSSGALRMSGPIACPERVARIWPIMLRRMAARIDDVRSWVVMHGDYSDSLTFALRAFGSGERFTWFVDPPYAAQATATNGRSWFPHGEGYRQSAVDYATLAEWLHRLPGQVVVCEQQGATWLPFRSLDAGHGDSQGVRRHEVVATWVSE